MPHLAAAIACNCWLCLDKTWLLKNDYIPRKISNFLLMGMDSWATGEDTTASGVARTHSLFGDKQSYLSVKNLSVGVQGNTETSQKFSAAKTHSQHSYSRAPRIKMVSCRAHGTKTFQMHRGSYMQRWELNAKCGQSHLQCRYSLMEPQGQGNDVQTISTK